MVVPDVVLLIVVVLIVVVAVLAEVLMVVEVEVLAAAVAVLVEIAELIEVVVLLEVVADWLIPFMVLELVLVMPAGVEVVVEIPVEPSVLDAELGFKFVFMLELAAIELRDEDVCVWPMEVAAVEFVTPLLKASVVEEVAEADPTGLEVEVWIWASEIVEPLELASLPSEELLVNPLLVCVDADSGALAAIGGSSGSA